MDNERRSELWRVEVYRAVTGRALMVLVHFAQGSESDMRAVYATSAAFAGRGTAYLLRRRAGKRNFMRVETKSCAG
jgi:hypothetical protein